MTIKIVHCSDLHLDRVFNISNFALAQERKTDLNKNLTRIVDFALDRKADLFLVSGDTYDKITPTNATSVFLTEQIRKLHEAGVQVFMIGGNHDVPKIGRYANLAIENLQSAGLARVFARSDALQKETLEIHGKKVCVSGKSYNAQEEFKNPLKDEAIPLEGDCNILMLHAALQGLNVVSSIPEYIKQSPIYADDIAKGLSYLALGHLHNFFTREHRGCLIGNPGSIERLTWNELHDEKGFLWIELDGSKARWEHVRLPVRRMRSLDLTVSKESGDLNNHIQGFLTPHKDETAITRLNLKGSITPTQYNQFKIADLYRLSQALFFHFTLDRRELAVEDYGRIFFERIGTPTQAYQKRLDSLITNAETEEERKLLERVKELGVKYLEANP